jgi:predicted enzyme related to lactoylglutathione lyase
MPDKTSYLPGEPNWIDLGTPDLDASLAFYTSLFGWTVERGGEDVGGYSIVLKDGKRVAGVGPLMQPQQPIVWTSYLCTEDADKTAELVASNGGSTYLPPMDVMDIGRMAIFGDPTGAAIAVWQPKTHLGAEIIGEEGTFGWTELSTRDQQAALPFYREVFGLTADVKEGYTEFQVNGQSVAGCMDMPEMVPAEVPSYWMPYFMADDPAAKAQLAASLGGTVIVPFMEMAEVAFSVVQDPHGATFGLLKLLR